MLLLFALVVTLCTGCLFGEENTDRQCDLDLAFATNSARQKLEILRSDEGIGVPTFFAEEYPYSTVVRVDETCTGTLIGPRHVLTSAYCVDGQLPDDTKANHKVQLLLRNGSFEEIGVQKLFVPRIWQRKLKGIFFAFDFAVLELVRDHGRKWMSMGTGKILRKQNLHTVSYVTDQGETKLWHKYCHVFQVKPGLLLNHCDVPDGMEGAALYVFDEKAKKSQKIVGLTTKKSFKVQNWSKRINLAVRLNDWKIKQICWWIGGGQDCIND